MVSRGKVLVKTPMYGSYFDSARAKESKEHGNANRMAQVPSVGPWGSNLVVQPKLANSLSRISRNGDFLTLPNVPWMKNLGEISLWRSLNTPQERKQAG